MARSKLFTLVTAVLFLGSGVQAALKPRQIKNLVTFGDSYTDVVHTGDNGTSWPIYAASYANLSLYPYAVAGAACSNELTPTGVDSVEDQLSAYFKNGTKLNPEKTLYTLWIGTNDIGQQALLTQYLNATLVEVTDCMVNWVQALYDKGARNFLFQNVRAFCLPCTLDGRLTGALCYRWCPWSVLYYTLRIDTLRRSIPSSTIPLNGQSTSGTWFTRVMS
jgi:phospholipase/lecithinase/hemolysin